jgi:hypothetical protein
LWILLETVVAYYEVLKILFAGIKKLMKTLSWLILFLCQSLEVEFTAYAIHSILIYGCYQSAFSQSAAAQ